MHLVRVTLRTSRRTSWVVLLLGGTDTVAPGGSQVLPSIVACLFRFWLGLRRGHGSTVGVTRQTRFRQCWVDEC